MNRLKKIAILLIQMSILLAACAPAVDDMDVEVVVALTQTAAVAVAAPPAEVTAAVPIAAETAWISGTAYCVYGPPNPPMAIYAVETTTDEWYMVETEGTDSEAPYMLEVTPGNYHLFAYAIEGQPGYAAFTAEGTTLAEVTAEANQTASGTVIHPPGQSACGPVFGVPASPDGRFAAIAGPTEECLSTIDVSEAPLVQESALMRIYFQPGLESAGMSASINPGSIEHYVLTATLGQELTVIALPIGAVTLSIRGADGTVLLPDVAAVDHYSGLLPATQDYYIDVFSIAPETIVYSLEVSIPAQTQPAPEDDTPGSISGVLNYPQGAPPAYHVVATNLETDYWYWVGFAAGAYYYAVTELPPGAYHVVAYTENGQQVGGHASAGDGELMPVTVNPGEMTESVDISIWLEPGSPYFPPDPL